MGEFRKIERSKCAKLTKAQSHLQLDHTLTNVQCSEVKNAREEVQRMETHKIQGRQIRSRAR